MPADLSVYLYRMALIRAYTQRTATQITQRVAENNPIVKIISKENLTLFGVAEKNSFATVNFRDFMHLGNFIMMRILGSV